MNNYNYCICLVIRFPWLAGDDVEKLTSDLEDQYTQGMEHRLSGKARSHTGLGFTAPTLDVVGEGSGRHGEDGKESSGDDKIKVSLSLYIYLHIIG